MPPSEVFVIAMGVLFLIGSVVVAVDKRVKKNTPKKKGEQNRKDYLTELLQRCRTCGKNTDPEVDIHDSGKWWHKECLKKDIER